MTKLYEPANHKPRLLAALACTTLIGTGAVASHTANASFTSTLVDMVKSAFFSQNAGNEDITNVNNVVNALTISVQQSALFPTQVGAAINEASHKKVAIEQGKNIAMRVAQIHEDHKIGKGFTPNLACTAMVNNQIVQIANANAQNISFNQVNQVAAKYNTDSTNKRYERTLRHLENYCDTSEVKHALCNDKPTNLPSADSNYDTIIGETALSPEKQAAAKAYMLNVVDPANTLDEECETASCQASKNIQRPYNALASLVHSAYTSQVNDRVIYDTEGAYDYSQPVGDANEFNEHTVNQDGTPGTSMEIPSDFMGMLDTMLKAIASGEARSPEAYNNGTACSPAISKPNGDGGRTLITSMTPIQILNRNNSPCSSRLFAVGLYQFTPAPLREAINKFPQYANQPLTAQNQRELAIKYFLLAKRPALSKFLLGQPVRMIDVQADIAKEWASVAAPVGGCLASDGRCVNGHGSGDGKTTYYNTSNKNKAAKHSAAEIGTVLNSIQNYFNNGGKSPFAK